MLVVLALLACGPDYRTTADYTPPSTPEGAQCVAAAGEELRRCTSRGRIAFDQCRRRAEQAAIPRYQAALSAYNLSYLNSLFLCRNLALRQVDAMNLHPGGVQQWVDRRCREPRAPDLEDFVDLSPCGHPVAQCATDYDIAFQVCGGTITRSTRCISNCP